MTSRSKKSSAPVADGSDRTKYIGGSDAAAILGVSPWRSTYRAWCEKSTGEVIPNLSLKPWIEWGNYLEPVVAQAFTVKTGIPVEIEPRFLVHSKHIFLGGHIDRRIKRANAFLECKTTNAYDNRMWGDEEEREKGVPLHYLAQCDHYLLIGDFEYCYIAVLIGGNDFRMYRIERSIKRERELLAAELRFWDMVQNDIMPAIESEEDARHRWKKSFEGTAVPVDVIMRAKVAALSVVSDRRKIAEKEEKKLRDEIFPVFEDNESMTFNGETIAELTWYYRKDLDREALAKKHPKILKKFTKETPAKRLKLLI